jgi:magnesium-transporting ATPase (P-type)
MLRPCSNQSGTNDEKICWTQSAFDLFTNTTTRTTRLPFVSLVFNAGQWAYNTRQAAGFVAFVLGELLFLFTVRTEQPFWHAFYFFNRWFYGFCLLGVCLLCVLIYVPIVALSMGLSPMSAELVVIVWGFCLILPASSECCKVLYRDAVRKYHATLWAQIGPDAEPLGGELSKSVKLEVSSKGSMKGSITDPLLGP